MGPQYTPPQLTPPERWTRVDDARFDSTRRAELAEWWRQLHDPALSALVEAALTANYDLKRALASVREARARRLLASAEYFPTLSLSVDASRAKAGRRTGGSGGGTSELYSAGFDASWEPDVFGGVRRGVEAAQADLEASEASFDDARVSLTAEVALNYVELRAFQARLGIARVNLDTQTETFRITEWRAQAGLVGALDVEQARASLEQTRAQIPILETGRVQAEHRLAVLIGQAPAALAEQLAIPAAIPSTPDRVAIGIPADTLRQRPDVRVAERRLAAQTARIGQSEAARYPSLALSGSIGLEAFTLSGLGASGAAAQTIAARIAQVIFDAGRLREQVEIQSALAAQALAAYEGAVLTALEDVENALVALARSRERAAALRTAADAARNAALLARQRYESGLIDFLTVLDTQRTVLSIEDNLASTEADSASALIQLYKALGGGWSTL